MSATKINAPARQWQPLRRRATFALLLTGAHIILVLAAIASGLAEIDLLQRLASGEPVTVAEAINNDDRQAVIGGLYFISFAGVAVSFLIWLNRASKNLSSLSVVEQRFSPAWGRLVVYPHRLVVEAVPSNG